jgi:hypothetical protein
VKNRSIVTRSAVGKRNRRILFGPFASIEFIDCIYPIWIAANEHNGTSLDGFRFWVFFSALLRSLGRSTSTVREQMIALALLARKY